MPDLAALGSKTGALVEHLVIPGRNHTSALTSRAFKQAATEFLAV
jgi:hypothetical protein